MLGGAFMAIAFTACGGGGYGGGGGGMGGGGICGGVYVACPPPVVSITTPANGDTVSGTVMITASATASATYSLTITSVQFFLDGTSLGTVTAAPYTFSWNSATATKGSHMLTAKATDSMSDTATSTAVTVTTTGMAAAMSAEQIFPMTASSASGVARVAVDRESGVVSGRVTLSGLEARSVTVREGFAGTSGAAVLALTPRAGSAGMWDVPAGARLTPEQLAAFGQGRLYVLATSAAHPSGEIRGQLAPESIRVTFTPLSATSEAAAAFGSNLSAVAATTVDTVARTVTVHVSSRGIEQTTSAALSSGTRQLAQLTRDAAEPGHWSSELARISAADIESFQAGRWGVSVAAAAAPRGAMVGLIEPRD